MHLTCFGGEEPFPKLNDRSSRASKIPNRSIVGLSTCCAKVILAENRSANRSLDLFGQSGVAIGAFIMPNKVRFILKVMDLVLKTMDLRLKDNEIVL